MRFWTGETIKELKENQIFVFGSNPSGIHGAGAAKIAVSFGAKYGVGRGLQGQTYALITKNLKAGFTEKSTGITYEKDGFNSVTPEQISRNIEELYICAKQNSDKLFIVVYKMKHGLMVGLKKVLMAIQVRKCLDSSLIIRIYHLI